MKNMKKNFLHCAKCFKKFCCNACINQHLNEFHEKSSKDLPLVVNNSNNNQDDILKSPRSQRVNKGIDESFKSQQNESMTEDDKIRNLNYQPHLEVIETSRDGLEEEEKEDITPEPKSPFIKKGYFLDDVTYNTDYDFSNFELRRDQPLGRGAFGDVVLSIHKATGKRYAIKQVKH